MSLGNANIHQRGEIPEIEKLPNNRIRVIRRFQKFTREDVDNANLGSLMGDFGALDTTDEQISGQGYTDCRLISVEVDSRFNALSNADNAVLVKTYETLTSSFVETTDPLVEFADNGLKKITKVYRAVSGTTSSNTVGEHTLSTGEILASSKIEDNTALAELTEIYLEEGTLSESVEEVGSQKAITKETIGSDPITPTGYSIASKDESNFEGYQTNRFRFLKNNVVLSESEDKIGSQLAIVKEVFNGTPDTPSGYSLADSQTSNVDGIPTKRFRFLKDNVTLSESEDKVGSQLAIVKEVFNGTPDTPAEYSVANEQESNVDGIPTKRVTFLKDDVVLSETKDKVGSQLSITQEVFNGTPDTPSGYSIANERTSDVEGVPTKRFTFLKDNVVLSESEDKVGSQLAIVQEVFNGEPSTPSGYSLANSQESNVDGITTKRFTFLKDDTVLSRSEDKVGSQLAIVTEVFKPTSDPSESEYSVARTEVSDVEGIPTKKFTFLKDDTVLSRSEDLVGSQLSITIESFNPTSDPTESGYSIARTDISDVEGIPTKRFTLLKDDAELSKSEDLVGSQLAIVTEVFNPSSDPTETGYSVARTEVSNVEGIPTKRFTFLKDDVELSRNEDKVGSQLAITTEVFNPTSDPTESDYSIARKEVSNVDGIPTKRFTFLKNNVTLSETEDKVGSQLAITKEVFKGTPDTPSGYVIAQEEESNVDGIPTRRFTFLKENAVLSKSEITQRGDDTTQFLTREVQELFKPTGTPTSDINGVLVGEEESDVDGIPTKRFTFVKGSGQIIKDERPAMSQLGSCKEVTITTLGADAPADPSGVIISRRETENNGYKTFQVTAIQGNITGTKQTYKDVVEVVKAGEVSCDSISESAGDISGTIAVAQVTPPRTVTLAATVTVQITTDPPSTASLAYDLSEISCSVVSTTMSENFRGSDVFVTSSGNSRYNGQRKSASMSAKTQTYPNCFLTSSSNSGTFSYVSSYENTSTSPNIINAQAQTSTTTSNVKGTGATSDTSQTSGILKRNSRPIFSGLENGNTYYEVVTWSVGT
jgi:hypothetical protein